MRTGGDEAFVRVTRETFDPARSFWWPSRSLRAKPVTAASRAMEIIQRMCEPESKLLGEMQAHLGDIISQMFCPTFWDKYFQAYDTLVSFNAPYRQLLQLADRHLPMGGRVLDLGAGTGNFSLLLALESPERSFILVDQSPTGLALAKTKFLARFGERRVSLRTVIRSLLAKTPFPKADGAVMNNVLYSIPDPADKLAVLKRIAKSLSPKGRFFLNDPLPTTGEAAFFRECFIHIVLGAVTEATPMTEFDLAVLTAANLRLTLAEGRPDQSRFLGIEEMTTLCKKAGFALVATAPTYVGVSQAYFLEKKGDR